MSRTAEVPLFFEFPVPEKRQILIGRLFTCQVVKLKQHTTAFAETGFQNYGDHCRCDRCNRWKVVSI